jgi:hypothetical protein
MIRKTSEEINDVLNEIDTNSTRYKGLSYEIDIETALCWVIGEITDEEFEYSKHNKGV